MPSCLHSQGRLVLNSGRLVAAVLSALLLTATGCTPPATSNSPSSVTVGDAPGNGAGSGADIARKHCDAWGKSTAGSDKTAQNGSENRQYTCR
jgi:hypothetical protein